MSPPQPPSNHLRRTLGVLLCQSPVLVALACILWPDGLPWVPVHTWHDASLWDA